jgi:hypothetical protein
MKIFKKFSIFLSGSANYGEILTGWRKKLIWVFAADVAELADAQVSGTCGLSPWRFDSSHPHWTTLGHTHLPFFYPL